MSSFNINFSKNSSQFPIGMVMLVLFGFGIYQTNIIQKSQFLIGMVILVCMLLWNVIFPIASQFLIGMVIPEKAVYPANKWKQVSIPHRYGHTGFKIAPCINASGRLLDKSQFLIGMVIPGSMRDTYEVVRWQSLNSS